MSKYTSNLGLFPYVKSRSPVCLDTVDTTTDWQTSTSSMDWGFKMYGTVTAVLRTVRSTVRCYCALIKSQPCVGSKLSDACAVSLSGLPWPALLHCGAALVVPLRKLHYQTSSE